MQLLLTKKALLDPPVAMNADKALDTHVVRGPSFAVQVEAIAVLRRASSFFALPHTTVHTYIHTHIHTDIQTYIHTCLDRYMSTTQSGLALARVHLPLAIPRRCFHPPSASNDTSFRLQAAEKGGERMQSRCKDQRRSALVPLAGLACPSSPLQQPHYRTA